MPCCCFTFTLSSLSPGNRLKSAPFIAPSLHLPEHLTPCSAVRLPSLPSLMTRSPAMPRIQVHEDEDILPTWTPTLPRSRNPPSPPTSGIPGLLDDDDDADLIHPHSSRNLPLARSTASEEIDFDDFYSETDHPHHRRDTETLQTDSLIKKEDSDPNDHSRNKKPSKYNTKPPPINSAPTAAMPTLRNSPSSGSVRNSPRNHKSIVSPVKSSSSTSTPSEHSSKPGSKTASGLYSVRSGTIGTPTPNHNDADEVNETDEEGDGAEESEDESLPERPLRKRTLKQKNPFKFDKHQHQAQKTGKGSTTKNIEKAVKEEIVGTQRKPPKKKARTSGSSAGIVATKAKAKKSSIDKPVFDPAKVTLRVRLDGFAGGAAPITLERCSDIKKLMDFIIDSWDWNFNGGRFSHAIASFPWLDADSNIVFRPGFEDSFQDMVTKAGNAPIWTEGDNARCEVDVTVYVRA